MSNITHGLRNTPEYSTWANMKSRCFNKNIPDYKDYGGRGITVCNRWLKFENFFSDMGERPIGLTLERINNNKGYFTSNCIWASQTVQARNHRKPKNGKNGHIGVAWRKESRKYRSYISVNYKHIHLGYFKTIEEAIEARRKGEIKYWKKGE